MPRKPTCECGECRKCKKRAYMRDYYQAWSMEERRAWVARRDPEKVREAEKARHRRDREKRLQAMRDYQATPKAKAAHSERTRAWSERNPEKRRAHWAVGYAIRSGKIERGACEVCGTTDRVEAHHDDYSAPLDVRWLCKAHHVEHHTGFVAEAA